jgi:hypothetical protein
MSAPASPSSRSHSDSSTQSSSRWYHSSLRSDVVVVLLRRPNRQLLRYQCGRDSLFLASCAGAVVGCFASSRRLGRGRPGRASLGLRASAASYCGEGGLQPSRRGKRDVASATESCSRPEPKWHRRFYAANYASQAVQLCYMRRTHVCATRPCRAFVRTVRVRVCVVCLQTQHTGRFWNGRRVCYAAHAEIACLFTHNLFYSRRRLRTRIQPAAIAQLMAFIASIMAASHSLPMHCL